VRQGLATKLAYAHGSGSPTRVLPFTDILKFCVFPGVQDPLIRIRMDPHRNADPGSEGVNQPK
jgi:hypothetical protein